MAATATAITAGIVMNPLVFGSMGSVLGAPNRVIWSSGFKPTSERCRFQALKAIGAQGRARERRPQNVDGEFFVDHTCIDCDTCRWMAPEIFTRAGGMSAVTKQPTCQEERMKALQALLSCPSTSIRTEKPPADILEAQETFPAPIDEQKIPGVYHCGYHSEKSFGAASYLIVHPEGNILVDSPRFTERLAQKIEMLGTVQYMFLTHKDDIADHEKWSKRLNCERILHSLEVQSSTTGVEMKLEGSGPWNLNQDIQLIHTPGHSAERIGMLILQAAQDFVYRGSLGNVRTWVAEHLGEVQSLFSSHATGECPSADRLGLQVDNTWSWKEI